jgi:hypothetical protein
MLELPFSYNWNNKLQCGAFTTLRLYNPTKHIVGTQVRISLKGQVVGEGVIAAVKPLLVDQINDFIAYIDTGYNAESCKEIIRKMYGNIDLSKTKMVLILVIKKG